MRRPLTCAGQLPLLPVLGVLVAHLESHEFVHATGGEQEAGFAVRSRVEVRGETGLHSREPGAGLDQLVDVDAAGEVVGHPGAELLVLLADDLEDLGPVAVVLQQSLRRW